MGTFDRAWQTTTDVVRGCGATGPDITVTADRNRLWWTAQATFPDGHTVTGCGTTHTPEKTGVPPNHTATLVAACADLLGQLGHRDTAMAVLADFWGDL